MTAALMPSNAGVSMPQAAMRVAQREHDLQGFVGQRIGSVFRAEDPIASAIFMRPYALIGGHSRFNSCVSNRGFRLAAVPAYFDVDPAGRTVLSNVVPSEN